jgi:hypothetical protein
LKSGRLPLLGVRRRYWSTPVGAIVALLMIETAQKTGFAHTCESAELSWILDSNERIKRIIEEFGGTVNKRYRIYEKAI